MSAPPPSKRPRTSSAAPQPGPGPAGIPLDATLSYHQAPETNRFNSPLISTKPDSKPHRFHPMTGRGPASTSTVAAAALKRASAASIAANVGVIVGVDGGEGGEDGAGLLLGSGLGGEGGDDEDGEDGEEQPKRKFANKRNATSTGRRKIDIEYIGDKNKRHVTFTKRKAGLMKKAFELSTLTGTNCLVVVVSETGLIYTYSTPGLQGVVAHERGKAVIAASLAGELVLDAPIRPLGRNGEDEEGLEPEEGGQQMSLDFGTNVGGSNGGGAGGGGVYHDIAVDQPHSHSHHPHHVLSDNGLPPLPLPMVSSHDDHSTVDPTLRFLETDYTSLLLPPPSSNPSPSPATLSALPNGSQPPSSSTSAYSLPIVPTPFERASAEHAAAFANYQQASTAVFGANDFGEGTKKWLPGGNGGGGEGGGGKKVEGDLQRRRREAKEAAEMGLRRAKENPTIPLLLLSHTLHLRAQQAVPPLLDSRSPPMTGIEATLDQFHRMFLNDQSIDTKECRVEGLGKATKRLVEGWLPAQSLTPKQLAEARTHLTLFFDYLEGHSFISSTTHERLTSFDFTAFDQEEEIELEEEEGREEKVKRLLEGLARDEFGVGVGGAGGGGEKVKGWFEVYRVRKGWCLLKERDLEGSPTHNATLAPFKVRLTNELTDLLKLEDGIWLEIVALGDTSATTNVGGGGKTEWMVGSVGAFDPTTDPLALESDIDPSSYADELSRLEQIDAEGGIGAREDDGDEEERMESIRWNRETLEMLKRAREALEEAE